MPPSPKAMPPRRYPGIQSFSTDQKDIFFGRRIETEHLYYLIRVNPVNVMFAESGIGKTSLLQAGVLPKLVKEFIPIEIRFQEQNITPLEQFRNAIKDFSYPAKIELYAEKDLKGKVRPWETFKSREITSFIDDRIPLLIFDQFEEFFRHPKNSRDEFREELAYLTNKKVPYRVSKKFSRVPRAKRNKEMIAWCSPVEVSVLFVLRSDQLHHMEELSEEIPSILKNRFQLLPLNTEQATHAILDPSKLTGPEYVTQAFTIEQELLSDMLSIQNDRGEVESWQLQVLCEYMENKVYEEQQEASKDKVIAKRELLGGKEGIQGIIADFYNRKIKELGDRSTQYLARLVLEDDLIHNNSRDRVSENALTKREGVSVELLQALVDKRLLKPENSRDIRTYEISHDTLIEPLLKSKKLREEIEEEAQDILKGKRQRREEDMQDRIAREEQKKARRFQYLFRLVVLQLLALFLMILITSVITNKFMELVGESDREKIKTLKSKIDNHIERIGAASMQMIYRDPSKSFRMVEFAVKEKELETSTVKRLHEDNAKKNSLDKLLGILSGNQLDENIFSKVMRDSTKLQDSLIEQFIREVDGQKVNVDSKAIGKLGHFLSAYYSGSFYQELIPQEWGVKQASFSPNGDYVVTASNDDTVRVWKFRNDTLQLPPHFKAYSGELRSATFSPDGNYLLTTSYDSTAVIWDSKGISLDTLNKHEDILVSSSWSKNGNLIVTGAQNGQIIVWRWENEQANSRYEWKHLHSDTSIFRTILYTVAFSPQNSRYLVSAINEPYAKVWDTKNLKGSPSGRERPIGTLGKGNSGHKKPLRMARFSPNGEYILTCSEDNRAILWNGDPPYSRIDFLQHDDIVTSGNFSDSANFIVTTSGSELKFWEYTENSVQELKDFNFHGHFGNILHASLSPINQSVISVSEDNTVKLWKWGPRATKFWELNPGIRTENMSYSGDTIVSIFYNKKDGSKKINFWGLKSKTELNFLPFSQLKNTAKFTLDGQFFFTHNDKDSIEIFKPSFQGDNCLLTKQFSIYSKIPPATLLFPDSTDYFIAKYGREWKSEDKELKFWDKKTKREIVTDSLKPWYAAYVPTKFLRISHKGDKVAICTGNDVLLGDIQSGKDSVRLRGHKMPVSYVSFSYDDKYLAVASEDNKVSVWEVDSVQGEKPYRELTKHTGAVNSVEFSQDSTYMLVSASHDNKVKLWNLSSGKEVIELSHQNYVKRAFFSPKDEYIISFADDGKIRIWPIDPMVILDIVDVKKRFGNVYKLDEEDWKLFELVPKPGL